MKKNFLKMSGILVLVLGFGLTVMSCGGEPSFNIAVFNDTGSDVVARFFIRDAYGAVTHSTHTIRAGQTVTRTGVRGSFRVEVDQFMWTYWFPAGNPRPFALLERNVRLRFGGMGPGLVPD